MQEEELKKAAAFRYKAFDNAPVLLAYGEKQLAERIVAIARENDIPISQQPEAVLAVIKGMQPGQEIPTELYEVLAGILAFLSHLPTD